MSETKRERKRRMGMNNATRFNFRTRKNDGLPIYFGNTGTPYVNPENFS